MCSPAAFIGAGIGAGAGLSIVSGIGQYYNAKTYGSQQAALAQQTAAMQNMQYQMQAAFQRMQAGAFRTQSAALLHQADAYMAQSAIAARTGEILQANQMHRAAQAEYERDQKAAQTTQIRRLLIGEAKTQFAANGVLLETRPQSAVAMWERDEVTSMAFELQEIKRLADNEIFGYVQQGYQDRMQGLFQAEALRMQAAGSRIDAGNAIIQAAGANAQARISLINGQIALLGGQAATAQARANTNAALWNLIGNIGGVGMSLGMYGATR